MRRRDFLRGGVAAIGAAALSPLSVASARAVPESLMANFTPRRMVIAAGAARPFRALHISDSHLCLVNDSDNERKHSLARSRSRIFPQSEANLKAALDYFRKNDDLLVHTGDFYDFVSEANINAARDFFRKADAVFASGNHDFSQYVGDAEENDEYKAQSIPELESAVGCRTLFSSRIVNGVNFMSLDNSYYRFNEEQFDFVRQEFARKLPVVILCHVPLYTPVALDRELIRTKGKCGYMAGVPESITSTYETVSGRPENEKWKDRSVQQRADKTTLKMIGWLKRQPCLKAVLCGHTHDYFAEQFSPTAMQYIVGACYSGHGYDIDFV
ncbi:MAG: metallophosphoesterase family protein [Candidatus Cryptobacteroides sp.]